MSISQAVFSLIHRLRDAASARRLPLWSIPLALLALVVLTYGLRALSLGFFWDDWPYLWYFHLFGGAGIVDAFTSDRPFLSFIYSVSLSLLGSSPRAWQVFTLLAHWLCCVSLWAVLAITWPRSAHKAAWAAFLFAVYPGFTQNWIAIIYGQAYLLFAAALASMALTLWLARTRPTARLWLVAGSLLSVALAGFTMFSTEYFFGLELLRPLLLWLVLSESAPAPAVSDLPPAAPDLPPAAPDLQPAARRWAAHLKLPALGRALLWWSPYLALMLAFVFWRGVLHTFPGKELVVVSEAESSPLQALSQLALTAAGDFIEAGPVAWGQTLALGGILEDNPAGGVRLVLFMLGTGLLALLYLLALRPAAAGPSRPVDRPADRPAWAWQAGVVGVLALLMAGWPFWVTALPMRMGFPQDRYSLPLAVGVCLALAALIDGLLKDLPRKALALAVLLALAAGFHFNLALQYRQDWNNMRSFMWQLTWRAPGVAPNTLFLFDRLPFRYYEDDSLTAPLNWVYAPQFKGRQMPYLLYDLTVRHRSLNALIADQAVYRDFRATFFEGSTSQALVVDYQSTGCLHMLDPRYDSALYSLTNRLQVAMPLSAPERWVLPDAAPAQPPAMFGSEPPHRWCYYYQKAELARQAQDWQAIPALARASLGEGLKPDLPLELLPFVEGFARVGQVDDAYQLSLETINQAPGLRPALCAIWQRVLDEKMQNPQAIGDSLLNVVAQMNETVGCSIK